MTRHTNMTCLICPHFETGCILELFTANLLLHCIHYAAQQHGQKLSSLRARRHLHQFPTISIFLELNLTQAHLIQPLGTQTGLVFPSHTEPHFLFLLIIECNHGQPSNPSFQLSLAWHFVCSQSSATEPLPL